MKTRRRLLVVALAASLLSVERAAAAETYQYVGPNNGSWQTPGNWTPFNPPAGFNPPPGAGDTAIINIDRDVVLFSDVVALAGLVLANNGDLLTAGELLGVYNAAGDAEANIVGTGTTGNNTELFVQPNTGGFVDYGLFVDVLNLENGAELDLVNDAVAYIDNRLNVDELSIITGRGTIFFTGSHGFNGRRFDLRGTLRPDAGGTIRLEAATGTIDLDGQVHNNNLVDLTNNNSRLIVDGPLRDSFTGTIRMGSGSTLTMQNAWTLGPEPGGAGGASMLRFDPGDGQTATVNGADIIIGGAGEHPANVRAVSGFGRVTADATIQSNADILVYSDGVLDFDGELSFTGPASISGGGEFDPGTNNRVLADVTISTDTFDFDAGDWEIFEELTLNVDTTDEIPGNWFGLISPGDPVINIVSQTLGGFLIDDGRINVNLPGSNAWTLADDGTINITGLSGSQTSHSIAGSQLDVGGTINIDGRTRFTAPIDLIDGQPSTAGVIQFADSGSSLELTSDSRLSGGSVVGPGELRSSGAVVEGHGTIAADVNFNGTSALRAEGGTLLITGNLDDLGAELGVMGPSSTLQIEDLIWDIAQADEVVLRGGLLADGAVSTFVQNRGGVLRGHGAVSLNSLTNNGLIAAEGRTLQIRDRLDWDGTGNALTDEGDGILRAETGDLWVAHPMYQGPSFVGTIEIAAGHFFRYETGGTDDEILFDDVTGDQENDSVGRLHMQGGALQADRVTHEGEFVISGPLGTKSAPSTIVANEILFTELGTTMIDSQLRLDASGGAASLIEPGAQFTGGGSLANVENSVLIVQDEAEVGVALVNEGDMHIGAGMFLSAVPAETEIQHWTQTDAGALMVNLAGTGLDEFDRIDALDGASLDGTLTVDLIYGFLPSLDDAFEVLTAGGEGVVGKFSLLDFPVIDGLTFDISYQPQSILLEVVAAIDPDMDNQITGLDFLSTQRNQPSEIPTWESQFGFGGPSPAAAATASVPEPTTLILLAVGVTALGCGRRHGDRT